MRSNDGKGLKSEVSVEGKKLGTSKKNECSRKSRVSICRVEFMRKVVELVEKIRKGKLNPEYIDKFSFLSESTTYEELKIASEDYCQLWRELKDNVLINWVEKPSQLKKFSLDT